MNDSSIQVNWQPKLVVLKFGSHLALFEVIGRTGWTHHNDLWWQLCKHVLEYYYYIMFVSDEWWMVCCFVNVGI